MNNDRIFMSSPHMSGFEKQYIEEAFESNWIAPLGNNVNEFEKEVAEYVGSKGSLALSSGTAGIHLALKLLGVKDGDIVFCSTLTFAASVNPVMYERAIPVFTDSEPESWNMCPESLKRAFLDYDRNGKLPKAVIVVNLYGQNADMDKILDICDLYNVPVIEDAAESLGATYKNKKSGTLGKFGIYSFNGNKIITTSGGGMLVSDDVEALEKAKFWATQSRDKAPHYQHSEIGYNYRLSNVLAGIGRGQLKVLDNRVNARRRVFDRYYKALSSIDGISFMPECSYGRSNRWLTVMTIDKEKLAVTPTDIMEQLEENNIESRPVWKPMHLQPVFKKYDYYPYRLRNCESISDNLFKSGLCLPSGSNLTKEEQEKVIEIIKKALME